MANELTTATSELPFVILSSGERYPAPAFGEKWEVGCVGGGGFIVFLVPVVALRRLARALHFSRQAGPNGRGAFGNAMRRCPRPRTFPIDLLDERAQ